MKKTLVLSIAVASVFFGCSAKSDAYRSDVYDTGSVNQQQSVKKIQITNVRYAKIAVDNTENKNLARTAGAVIGAAAGAIVGYNISGHSSTGGGVAGGAIGGVLGGVAGNAVDDKTIVDGVTLVYKVGKNEFSSTQVGKMCEYSVGEATMILTNSGETRIQPNSYCN